MVNCVLTGARAAERRMVLSYAPAAARPGLAALLALDATLGTILRTTSEPLIGQMRLTWWHDALGKLDGAPPPAEPVLGALAADVLPAGVTGGDLSALVEAWEVLLEPLDAAAIDRAGERGVVLFAAAARLLGGDPAFVANAGRGWALADLAAGLSDGATASLARDRARAALDRTMSRQWPRALRALGALTLLARDDVAERPSPAAGPRRTMRLIGHRLTGR